MYPASKPAMYRTCMCIYNIHIHTSKAIYLSIWHASTPPPSATQEEGVVSCRVVALAARADGPDAGIRMGERIYIHRLHVCMGRDALPGLVDGAGAPECVLMGSKECLNYRLLGSCHHSARETDRYMDLEKGGKREKMNFTHHV